MRRAVFATVVLMLTLSLSMAAQLPNYTAAQVAQHNTSTDCWIILNTNEVYNVTAFLSVHPAGPSPITPFCGKDATAAFNAVGHSSSAVNMEATYLIGNLVATTISVSISPATATVTAGQTQTFTATVTGSTQGVKWTSTSIGTIDQNGLFTAVSAGTGTVTATSVEDTTKSATAQVTVKSTGGGGGGVSVSLAPATASLSVGGTQQFTANVSGSSAGVTWTATGSVGTVDSNGLFTATKAGMGVVKATSVDDPTKSASATVSVTGTGAACSLTSAKGSFTINCIPASAIAPTNYVCKAKTSGNSTVVQCTSGRTGGSGDGGGGRRGDD